jgi:hypothetical protein
MMKLTTKYVAFYDVSFHTEVGDELAVIGVLAEDEHQALENAQRDLDGATAERVELVSFHLRPKTFCVVEKDAILA